MTIRWFDDSTVIMFIFTILVLFTNFYIVTFTEESFTRGVSLGAVAGVLIISLAFMVAQRRGNSPG